METYQKEYEINAIQQTQYDFAYRYNFNLSAINHFIHDLMDIDRASSSNALFEALFLKESKEIAEQDWVALQTQKLATLLNYELMQHNYNIDEVLQLLNQENLISSENELLDYAMQSLQINPSNKNIH